MIGRPHSPVPDLRVSAPETARLAATVLLAVMMCSASWIFGWPDWVARGLIAVGLTLVAVAGMMAAQTRVRRGARGVSYTQVTPPNTRREEPSRLT